MMAHQKRYRPRLSERFTWRFFLVWLQTFYLFSSTDHRLMAGSTPQPFIKQTRDAIPSPETGSTQSKNLNAEVLNSQSNTLVITESSTERAVSLRDTLAEYSWGTNNLDDLEEYLDISCRGRCGDRASFPCSCSDVCVFQGNCCHDMTTECSDEFVSGKNKFGHLLAAEVECSSLTNTFMVMSCSGSQVRTADLQQSSLIDKEVSSVSNSVNPLQSTGKTFPLPLSWTTGSQKTGERGRESEEVSTKSVSEEEQTERILPVSKILSLMLGSPVTDVTTGIIYKNQSISLCNNVSDKDIKQWSIKIAVVSVVEIPSSLDALEKIVSVEDFEYQPPLVATKVAPGNQCVSYSKRSCKEKWLKDRPELEGMCLNRSITYVQTTSKSSSKNIFDNIYCLLCNVGYINLTGVISEHNPAGKTFKLSLVASLTSGNALSIIAENGKKQLLWGSVECSLSGDGECETRECGLKFEMRPDGKCRTVDTLLIAIGRENCTYMISQKLEEEFLSIIRCYLETFEDAEIVDKTIRFDPIYDERLDTILFQTKVTVYFPSAALKVRLQRIVRDLQMLVHGANFYCRPSAPTFVCQEGSCLFENLEVPLVTTFDVFNLYIPDSRRTETLSNSFPILCSMELKQSSSSANYFSCLNQPINTTELRDFFHRASNVPCFGKTVWENPPQEPQRRMCNGMCSISVEKWPMSLFLAAVVFAKRLFELLG